jgi:hypothetical protein
MPNFDPTELDRKRGLSFHQRLLANDPVVPSELAEEYLPLLLNYLQHRFPNLEPELLSDAATEAYLNYVERPTTFDPARHSLLGYLQMSASGDVKNALAKQRRHAAKIIPLDVVALSLSDGNNNIEDQVLARLEIAERIRVWQEKQQVATDTELDRQLLALMQARVRPTHEYTRILGIEHLNLAEQRQIVKRHKDRLRVRLKRRIDLSQDNT